MYKKEQIKEQKSPDKFYATILCLRGQKALIKKRLDEQLKLKLRIAEFSKLNESQQESEALRHLIERTKLKILERRQQIDECQMSIIEICSHFEELDMQLEQNKEFLRQLQYMNQELSLQIKKQLKIITDTKMRQEKADTIIDFPQDHQRNVEC